MSVRTILSLFVTMLLGGLGYFAYSASASAMPLPGGAIPDLSGISAQNTLVQKTGYRGRHGYGRHRGFSFSFGYGYGYGYRPYYNHYRYGPRYGYRRYRYSHHHYGRYYSPPWWAGTNMYSYSGRYSYGSSGGHVRWCRNRYRSYNARTDQFLGYDGSYHYCRSPYRR